MSLCYVLWATGNQNILKIFYFLSQCQDTCPGPVLKTLEQHVDLLPLLLNMRRDMSI